MSERLRGALRVGRSGRRGAAAGAAATGCGVGAGAGSATMIGMSDVSSPIGGRLSSVSPCTVAGGSGGRPRASGSGSGSAAIGAGSGSGVGSGSETGASSTVSETSAACVSSCCGSGSCTGAVSGGGSSTTTVERIDGSAAGATAGPPKLRDPSAEPLSAARSASIDSIALLSAASRRAASARTVSFALAKRSGARICVLRR